MAALRRSKNRLDIICFQPRFSQQGQRVMLESSVYNGGWLAQTRI